MEIGHRIAKARSDAGLTQRQLAKMVHATHGLIAQWESHKKKPGRELLGRIAEATLVSMEYLLSGSPDRGIWVTDPDIIRIARSAMGMNARQRKNLADLISVSRDIRSEIDHQRSPSEAKEPVS